MSDSVKITTNTVKKTSFAVDVFNLASGTVIVQVISILASPLLTRLYSPEAFGILAIFNSFINILGVAICLRYELAIVLPESDEEAANLLALSLIVSTFFSLVSVPVFWLAGPLFAGWLNAPKLGGYLWLIPPVLLFGGINIGHPALNYWATRTKRFKEVSVTRVIGSFTTTGINLGAGFAGFASASVLIGANVISSIISPLILAAQIWREDGKLLKQSISWQGILAGLRRHRKFPLYSTWSALLNTFSVQLPVFLLSVFFAQALVGQYALGFRTLQIPMVLIGSALGQVFFQRASAGRNTGAFSQVVEKTFLQLVSLAIFPFLILTLAGAEIFKVIFGIHWTQAGIYVQILAPWMFFVFIGSPISNLNSVLETQEVGVWFNIMLLVTRALSLTLGGLQENILIALALFSSTGVVLWTWFCSFLLRKSGVNLWKILLKLGQRNFPALIFLLPVVVSKFFFHSGPLVILVVIALVLILHYLYMASRDDEIREFVFARLTWRKI